MDNIKGTVVRGVGNETKIFPTSNIRSDKLSDGIYLAVVTNPVNHGAVIFAYSGLLEIHIIGYEGDLYGQEIEVKPTVLVPAEYIVGFLKNYKLLPKEM